MRKNYDIKTSYFKVASNCSNSLSICPNTPPWYIYGKAEDVMCNKVLYNRYYKSLDITKEELEKMYIEETLSKLDPYVILDKYDGKILLGWYKPPQFDIRQLFTKWILEETGVVIPEATSDDLILSGLELPKIF
ncbi:hypothetical protein ACTNDZ_10960 [Selenomonas montiformis]|uniref:hypothetical protein n=1 Tax=Selenomonas montiformis TaxID=2652285 RepID=UPI003F8BC2F3